MSNEIEKNREVQGPTARDMFTKYEVAIKNSIPSFVNGEKLLKVALETITNKPLLMKCHPATLVGAFIQAAQLNLQLDGITGEAYLIPFHNNQKKRYDAQFMIGYKGLRKLVSNSGQICTFIPQIVYEGDLFDYNLSGAQVIQHKRTDSTNLEKIQCFYSIVKYKDGNIEHLVMTKKEVEALRDKHSKVYQTAIKNKRDDSTWHLHFGSMGMKSVMRKHAKYLPLSAENMRAVSLDELAEVGTPQDLGLLVDSEEVKTEPIEDKTEPIKMPERKSKQEEPNESEEPTDMEALPEEPKTNGNVRRIKANFDSLCLVCNGKIKKDDPIIYDPSQKKSWHTGCHIE